MTIKTPAFRYADLTLVLPTLNEGKSIGKLLHSLQTSYPGSRMIVVDDGSADETQTIVRGFDTSTVRLVDRSGAAVRGLTASLLEAIAAVETDYFIVMDADGQHPPAYVTDICRQLAAGAPLVVASRAAVDPGWGVVRRLISAFGMQLGRHALRRQGKHVGDLDILSGYFGTRRAVWERYAAPAVAANRFYLGGYKLLFDFLLLLPPAFPIAQVPYRFETRKADQSKINLHIYWQYLKSCLRALIAPPREWL